MIRVASGPLTRVYSDPLATGSPSLRSTTPLTTVGVPSPSTTSTPATVSPRFSVIGWACDMSSAPG